MKKAYLFLLIIITSLTLVLALGSIITFSNRTPLNNTYSNNFNQTFSINITTNATSLSNATLHIFNSTGTEIYGSSYNGLCYQESANTTNQTGIDGNCGLNYSGSYGEYLSSASFPAPSGSASWNNYSHLFDGNFTTLGYAYSSTYGVYGDFFINYTKPNGALNSSLWHEKSEITNSTNLNTYTNTKNITIPLNCFSQSEIQFKVHQYISSTDTLQTLYCYNGTGWEGITPNFGSDYMDGLYEEAMWWNIPNSGTSTTKSITGTSNQTSWNVTLPKQGIYNWYVNSQDNLGTSTDSSNYTLTIDTSTPTSTLISPVNYYSTNLIQNEFNATLIDNFALKNTTFYIWNSTGSLITTNSTNITGTSNSSQVNMTVSSDGTYYWNTYTCDQAGNCKFAPSNYTFYLITTKPAINLNFPANNSYLNYSKNIYFNFTATDVNGISQCNLYSNFNGTWKINETFNSVISGVQVSTQKNITDGTYLWNVECNNTLGTTNFAPNNRTFTIDTIKPNIAINSITTTKGSQTILFNSTINDTNLNYCTYSIYNSTGGIDGLNSNVLFTCNSNPQSATVTSYGNYTLNLTAYDLAGNLDSTSYNFTTSASNGTVIVVSGGGGTTTIVGQGNWTMQTTPNQKSYDKILPAGTSTKLSISFYNTGEKEQNITLACKDINGSFCQYVNITNPTFTLPLIKDLQTVEYFTITLPEQISPQKAVFDIIGTDSDKNINSISVTITTGNQEFFLEVFSKLQLNSKALGGLPYFLIFLILLGLFLAITSRFIRINKGMSQIEKFLIGLWRIAISFAIPMLVVYYL